jgi:hypothetical protein
LQKRKHESVSVNETASLLNSGIASGMSADPVVVAAEIRVVVVGTTMITAVDHHRDARDLLPEGLIHLQDASTVTSQQHAVVAVVVDTMTLRLEDVHAQAQMNVRQHAIDRLPEHAGVATLAQKLLAPRRHDGAGP